MSGVFIQMLMYEAE
jgi:chromosome segregation ATPase